MVLISYYFLLAKLHDRQKVHFLTTARTDEPTDIIKKDDKNKSLLKLEVKMEHNSNMRGGGDQVFVCNVTFDCQSSNGGKKVIFHTIN